MSARSNSNSTDTYIFPSSFDLSSVDFSGYGEYDDTTASAASSLPTPDWSAFNFDASLPEDVRFPNPSPRDNSEEEFPLSPFTPFDWNSSQFRDVNSTFETNTRRADAALAAIQSRTPELAPARPFAQTTIANLPRGPAPSLHAAASTPVDDPLGSIRLRHFGALDCSKVTLGDAKTQQPNGALRITRMVAERRARAVPADSDSEDEGDENAPASNGAASTKTNFGSGDALIKLASAAVDLQPFFAPFGQKGLAWQGLADQLKKDKMFRNTSISGVTVQRKVENLVAFKKQKAEAQQSHRQGDLRGITIAALLEGLEDQYDQAKGQSDENKAKIKKKADEDRIGGEAIREASKVAFSRKSKKRARSPTPPASDDDDATDTESASAPSHASRVTASPSVEIFGSGGMEQTAKGEEAKGKEKDEMKGKGKWEEPAPKRPRRDNPVTHQRQALAPRLRRGGLAALAPHLRQSHSLSGLRPKPRCGFRGPRRRTAARFARERRAAPRGHTP
ncbi:hypothetical protein R3P38DRAFT_3215204 [Favolaschia claudopus]|uniref:Uncharacterized protein n=1 Tax=Favolaschia claudopus TaxID=2862362 RepID=A0AAW0A8Q0_9AGAR